LYFRTSYIELLQCVQIIVHLNTLMVIVLPYINTNDQHDTLLTRAVVKARPLMLNNIVSEVLRSMFFTTAIRTDLYSEMFKPLKVVVNRRCVH